MVWKLQVNRGVCRNGAAFLHSGKLKTHSEHQATAPESSSSVSYDSL